MEAHVFAKCLIRKVLTVHRIVGDFLSDLEISLVSCIVFEDIENKVFLNSLSHAVEMEGFRLASTRPLPKDFKGLLLRRGGKGKNERFG